MKNFKPTFLNAVYYINQGELAYAKEPDPRSQPQLSSAHLGAARKTGTGCAYLRGRGDCPRRDDTVCTGTHTKPSDCYGEIGRTDRVFSGRLGPDTFAPENALRHGIRS